jgi:hypothetical protein
MSWLPRSRCRHFRRFHFRFRFRPRRLWQSPNWLPALALRYLSRLPTVHRRQRLLKIHRWSRLFRQLQLCSQIFRSKKNKRLATGQPISIRARQSASNRTRHLRAMSQINFSGAIKKSLSIARSISPRSDLPAPSACSQNRAFVVGRSAIAFEVGFGNLSYFNRMSRRPSARHRRRQGAMMQPGAACRRYRAAMTRPM